MYGIVDATMDEYDTLSDGHQACMSIMVALHEAFPALKTTGPEHIQQAERIIAKPDLG